MQSLEIIIIALLVVVLLAIFNIYKKMTVGHDKFSKDIGEIKQVLINIHKKKKAQPEKKPADEPLDLENFDGAPDYSSLETISHLERLGPHDAYMDEHLEGAMDGHEGMDDMDSDPL